MEIRPITLREANAFVEKYHRHNSPTVGGKFAIACFDAERLCGVAICGRPVSRHLDNGLTIEINRVCTDGTRNACSMLYGASCRIAREMGYELAITYTLQSETGASLKASNFVFDGKAGGTHWTGKRDRGTKMSKELKYRWVKKLK